MKPIDMEYAIKKDVRNNPIVREADRAQQYEFLRTGGVWALVVLMFLFAAWQHFEVIRHNFQIEKVDAQLDKEVELGRKLTLAIETLKDPARIEKIATDDLHMVVADPKNTIVVERVQPSHADKSTVASAAPALQGAGGLR